MSDRENLLQAVNLLILDDNAPTYYDALTIVAPIRENLPIGLTGPAEVLMPLVHMYRTDRDAYDRVLDLVDRKREMRGWPPLQPAPKGFDKVEYQRQFMDQKRQRERRAVEIENMLRPERDKLIGNARNDFMRHQSRKWKQRRDDMLEAARVAKGSRLSQDEYKGVIAGLWALVDQELDKLETEALNKMRGT